jgi:putative tricarboxylic transport membrane protein
VAPPDISAEGQQCLVALVGQMVASDEWQQTLQRYGWQDYFLPGEEFGAFIAQERDRVIGILTGLGLVAA